jgi:hypothetical protein
MAWTAESPFWCDGGGCKGAAWGGVPVIDDVPGVGAQLLILPTEGMVASPGRTIGVDMQLGEVPLLLQFNSGQGSKRPTQGMP